MEIRRLKLSGFKSFVDATELRVEPGLTGIVGPNGCGKSNLLEALRWAMGESSPKSMRGGGMEDVIFAGTATRPQRDFAEVVIGCEQAPAEAMRTLGLISEIEEGGGTLEVVRRIERGAGSAYRANGRDVRAKDVALIFADAATGAHSPALVSQGRIAAVIAARPQERRAMLEEAAGIAGLHVRRKDAEQKLRAAEANLARLDDVLADMDARAAILRRQARAAERYTRLTQQIRVAEARTLYARWREAAEAAETARAEAATADQAVRLGQEAQTAASAWVGNAVAKLAAARAAAQTARDAASEAGHRLETLKAERVGLLERLAGLAAQAERLIEDQKREDDLAHDAADAIARLTAEGAELAARIKAAEAARPDFAGRLAAAETAARDAEVALAHAMARQASEQAERRVAEAALASATTRLERAGREVDRIRAAAAAQDDATPLAVRRTEAEGAARQADADRAAAEAGLADAEAQRMAATEARGMAESALAAARAALAALDAEAGALVRATEKRSDGDRALDRIKAEPGYERALAAALGDDLEAAIGGGGKRRWAGAEPLPGDPVLPGGTQPLVLYVAAPDALARRLAQVAVAAKDEGQELAVGQRLVTLDGQLRRWDGYVAAEGGAAAADRLIRLNRLEAIAAARPEVAASVSDAETALAAASEATARATAAAAGHRAALDEAAAHLRAALRAADEAATAIERLQGLAAEIASRLAAAEEDHRQALRERDQAAAAVAELPDAGAAGGTADEVAALTQASEMARGAVARIQAEQAMTDRAIEADRMRAAAAEQEVKGWRARSGEAAKRIADMSARATAIDSEKSAIGGRPDALAAEIAHLSEGGVALRAEAEAAGAAERASEEVLRAMEAKLAAAGEALAAAREARAGATARAQAADERRAEISQQSGERFECPPPVLVERIGFDADTIRSGQVEHGDAERLILERERIGPVNLVAATELAELEETQTSSRAEAEELTQAINRLRGSIGSLNREGRARLLTAFEAVDAHFRRLFTTLFDGGQAHLELVESDDPLEAGLEIMAQPPGKKLSALTLLSGGEQALTAIALIFALFLTNPAPICVLDEVDAPLDDANVERFCDLLDHMVADTSTRYLIVTHNAVTMSRMHRLFGVTMVERGVSRLVSVDLSGAESLLAAE